MGRGRFLATTGNYQGPGRESFMVNADNAHNLGTAVEDSDELA